MINLTKPQKFVSKILFVLQLISIVCGISFFTVFGQENPDAVADEELSDALPAIPDDLTGGSPWINSNIPGNVTAETAASPKEDFYIWANKDWIASSKIPEGSQFLDLDVFAEGRARVKAALAGDALPDHDAHQVQIFYHAFIDTAAREAAGCEPLRQVIDELRSISSIDELTAFLLDIERSAGVPSLIKVENKKSYSEHLWKTRVELSNATFGSTMGTMGMDAASVNPDSEVYQARFALVNNILSRLGWTDEEVTTAFEGRLAIEREIIRIKEDTGEEDTAGFSLDQLNTLAGDFPLRELAETRGYGTAETFEVPDIADLRAAGALYTNEHLDDLRNYFICGYVLEAGSWLDTAAFNAWLADYEANGYFSSITMPERNESIEDTAVNLAAEIVPTLVGRAYVEAYDLAHTKDFIKSLCSDAIEAHKAIVNDSEWLSAASKQKLIDKLDAITMNVVYPDVWEDYSGLDLEGLDYYEVRRAIWLNDLARNARLTGTEIDDRLWDAPALIEGGGAYDAFTNSFHVDAGVVENEVALYEAGEISLSALIGGKTGYVVFHELAHAMDPGTIYFNAEGEYVDGSLLEPSDLGEYMQRAKKIRQYFDGISVWEGQYLDGSVCMQEALAEICGMQARLKFAAGKEGFDYRTLFEKRAQLAPCLHTPEYELAYIMGLDRHPAVYLDTNVTIQQFDEFLETFDVKPGDNMYLAPEDRLVIW